MSKLNLLFATNFSDSCFRAIRAVAQLADSLPLRLTIAHVAHPGRTRTAELHSFFAEADHYTECHRVTLHGHPAEAIATYARNNAVNLIIAPGSDRLGLPRPFHRSYRAALLRHAAAPVWTTSPGLELADFRRPIRTIAVALDGWDDNLAHLQLASSFAASLGARLRLLSVVPTVSESTLSSQFAAPQPLHPETALARIEGLLDTWNSAPSVDVAIGSAAREIPRMAARCNADLLFLSEPQSTAGFFNARISRTVSNSPCPVICTPKPGTDTSVPALSRVNTPCAATRIPLSRSA